MINYSHKVHSSKLLSQQEELQLISRFKLLRCQNSRDKLIEAHLRVAWKFAMIKCKSSKHHWFYDAFHEGIAGMLHALDVFEADKGVRFVTYAQYWVKYYIDKLALENFSYMSLSYSRQNINAINSISRYKNKNIYDMPNDEYHQALHDASDETAKISQADKKILSKFFVHNQIIQDSIVSDTRCQEQFGHVETQYDHAVYMRHIKNIVDHVDSRAADIFKQRVIDNSMFKDIALNYKISAERARQIYKKVQRIISDKVRFH